MFKDNLTLSTTGAFVFATSIADSDGNFRVAVRVNSSVFINANFSGRSNTIQVDSFDDQEVTLDGCLVIGDAAITVTLTWGETPRDLDSHLLGPDGTGGEFEIFFANRTEIINNDKFGATQVAPNT